MKCDQSKLDGMDEVVKTMHANSGLINEIPNGTTLEKADEAIITYLKRYAPTAGKSPLAGNSVYVDRGFIARDLPQLNAYLHYRTIDVSTIKELARRWHPKTYFAVPAKDGNHRALGDIRDSIAELDYYRSRYNETIYYVDLFKPITMLLGERNSVILKTSEVLSIG